MIDDNLKKLEENLKNLKKEAEELMNNGNSKEQEKGRGILYAASSSIVLFKNYTDGIILNKDIDLLNESMEEEKLIGEAIGLTDEAESLSQDDIDDLRSLFPCRAFLTDEKADVDDTYLIWLEKTAYMPRYFVHECFLIIKPLTP